LRIVTLCGMGFGTSLMLKMTLEEIFRKHGIKAELQAWDLGSAKGQTADVIVAPRDMEGHLKGFGAHVILIENLTNKNEIENKVIPVIKEILGKNKS